MILKSEKPVIGENIEYVLGCSISQFKEYFESLFIGEMTWEKFFQGKIHIDHIRPCKYFDLSKNRELLECFNYKNLQPLWDWENLQKGAKLNWKRA